MTSTPVCAAAEGPESAAQAFAPVPVPVRDGFEAASPGSVPPGWTAISGSWAVVADAEAPDGRQVVAGRGDRDPGFSILASTMGGGYSDFTASVAFRMDCVEHPHGVGLVVHWAGAGDHQIVRYSATEASWDLFTVKDGLREKQRAASVAPTYPEPGTWVTLRVVSAGGTLDAYDGGTHVLSLRLPAGHANDGLVGLFLRGSSHAAFDAFTLDDLALPAR